MTDRDDTHALLLSFDSDDPAFTRGFELGHIWTTLRTTDERTFTAHATNTEMLMRIGEALEMYAIAETLPDGWVEVTFMDAG